MKKQRDFEDLLNTAEMKDLFFRAEQEMFPKVQSSALSVTLFSGKVDAKICLEMGAAVLFDKPLLIVAIRGSIVPNNLRKCATVIEVSGNHTPEDAQAVTDAIKEMLAKQEASHADPS